MYNQKSNKKQFLNIKDLYTNDNSPSKKDKHFEIQSQHKNYNLKYQQKQYFLGGNFNEKKFRIRRKFIKKRFLDNREKSLYYTVIKPKSRVRGNIIVIPGWVGSHYMIQFLSQFSSEGYLVHTFDFTGRDYSKNYQQGSILNQHLKDVATIFEKVDSSIPTFIYAHCYGALIILVFLMLNPEVKISGVILSSPLTSLDKIRKQQYLKNLIFIKLLGPFLGPFIINSFINPTKLCYNNFILQKICQKNPKFFFLSISEGLAIIQALNIINKNYKRFTHSLLVVHGEKNQISKVHDVKNFFKKLNSQDKTLKIIKDQIHELYLDEGQKSIFNIMLEWIKERENNYESQISIYQKNNWNFQPTQKKYSKVLFLIFMYYFLITFILQNKTLKRKFGKKLIYPIRLILKFLKNIQFNSKSKYNQDINLHPNYL